MGVQARLMTFRPLLILLSACAAPLTAPHPPQQQATPTGDLHDFDFIAGAWTLDNHRLKSRFTGSNDWDDFPAVSCGAVYMGGVVNVDELHFPTKGWGGVTFRHFDVAERKWSIYWVNSKSGKLFPPVVGGFTGERGEFFGVDEDDGHPVKVRFLWIKHDADHAHWEQAFSRDGKTWETNWKNDLTRADPTKVCDGAQPRRAVGAP